jgi:RNA polymerase sigma-70 factor (ECF subfamily)
MQHQKNVFVINTDIKLEEQYKDINHKLISLCIKGDRKAQFELYKKYAKAMYNTSFRILKDSAEAEDAMQEGFLKAFRHIGTYSGTVSFGAWLKKIIINTSLDLLKKKRPDFGTIEDFKNIAVVEEDDAVPDIEYNLEKIKKALELLPDGYRVVFSLYFLEGYDHDEIAEITGISPSTSRSQLARARKKLLELISTIK